jgi:cytochrome P450
MTWHAPLRLQDIDLTDFELFVQGKAHDAWRLLRAEAPVHWNPGTALFPGFWSVTTYADVVTVSRDTTTYSSRRGISIARFAHFSGRFDSFSAESRINVERKVQQRQKALLQC